MDPQKVTNRPEIQHRMDPLSEVFGLLRIQEAIYKRLEATAPWGVRYCGDMGPRIRFMLVVRGSALLRFKNQRRTISLSGGDLSFSFSVMSRLR